MHFACYLCLMGETSVVQVRDVPTEAVETLKARASRRGQSLAAYLRELILEEASLPELDEVMARLAEDEPINYTAEDLREFMADGRR
jgi:plasmid stability protein